MASTQRIGGTDSSALGAGSKERGTATAPGMGMKPSAGGAAPFQMGSFEKPDHVQTFPRGRMERVNVGGQTVARAVFEPGWRWSQSVQPLAKTSSCQVDHFCYQIAGTMRIRMDNGEEYDCAPGTVCRIPAGHDAWVVGSEPVVVLDFYGASKYCSADAPGASSGTASAPGMRP